MKHLIAWWQSRQQAKAASRLKVKLLSLAIGRATDHGRAML